MQIISEASESVLTILKNFLKMDNCNRWSQYCVHSSVDEGVLVFNMLTREMVQLTQIEYDNFTG